MTPSSSEPHIAALVDPYRESTEVFEFYADAHRASLVALSAGHVLEPPVVRQIAQALQHVTDTHESPGTAQSNDYADFERRMSARIGPSASLLHLGRSRQDLLSAANRHLLREGLLDIAGALLRTRQTWLTLAEQHPHTVVPQYTHAVPAQPTSFAHYLLGYAEALARIHQRLVGAYLSVNRSPLRSAVLATSRFPLDRELIADLLGFEGVVENSYGANHIAPIDAIQDASHPVAVLALHVSQFAQDLSFVQPAPTPWLTIRAGPLTGVSSIMPQKRNPLVLEYLRKEAAEVLGALHTLQLLAHNTQSGMTDSRDSVHRFPRQAALDLLAVLTELLSSIDVDAVEAETQAGRDYSTMTEVADLLFDLAGIPFRTGHQFASELASFGRRHGLAPPEIPRQDTERIYAQITGEELPLTPDQLAEALDPRRFVLSRVGIGGPSLPEVHRMLSDHAATLASDGREVDDIAGRRKAAADRLRASFGRLLAADEASESVSQSRR